MRCSSSGSMGIHIGHNKPEYPGEYLQPAQSLPQRHPYLMPAEHTYPGHQPDFQPEVDIISHLLSIVVDYFSSEILQPVGKDDAARYGNHYADDYLHREYLDMAV